MVMLGTERACLCSLLHKNGLCTGTNFQSFAHMTEEIANYDSWNKGFSLVLLSCNLYVAGIRRLTDVATQPQSNETTPRKPMNILLNDRPNWWFKMNETDFSHCPHQC